jgi:hypothetical protein
LAGAVLCCAALAFLVGGSGSAQADVLARSTALTAPSVTVPPVTVPPVTLPSVTLPPVTLPPVTLPPVTLPPETLPPVTLPPVTLPPPVTIPPGTTPTTLPGGTVPTVAGVPGTLPGGAPLPLGAPRGNTAAGGAAGTPGRPAAAWRDVRDTKLEARVLPTAIASSLRSFVPAVALMVLIAGFLCAEASFDRRDPKLARSPLDQDDETLPFT